MAKTITVSIQDDKGRSSRFSVNFPNESTTGNIQVWLTDFLEILDPLIKGAIVSASLTVPLALAPGLRQVPQVDSDIEERLVAAFRTQGNYRTSVTLATFNDAFTVPLVATKERIPNFLDADVDALFNHFTMAGFNGYEPPADKRGDLIERVDKSRYKHRR